MNKATRSGAQVEKSGPAVVRRLAVAAAIGAVLTGAALVGATQHSGGHTTSPAVAATIAPGDCCSEEGPSSLPGGRATR